MLPGFHSMARSRSRLLLGLIAVARRDVISRTLAGLGPPRCWISACLRLSSSMRLATNSPRRSHSSLDMSTSVTQQGATGLATV